MDYKFLDKVVDQIVSETTIDYGRGKIYTPFYVFFLYQDPTYFHHISSYSFTIHCTDVYGLNRYEILYVWDKYREIIKDKIENNGL